MHIIKWLLRFNQDQIPHMKHKNHLRQVFTKEWEVFQNKGIKDKPRYSYSKIKAANYLKFKGKISTIGVSVVLKVLIKMIQ